MERFIAQGVSLIVSIIIARILAPTEYYVVGIVTVFFNFANIFITSGLNTALVQKKDSDSLDCSSVLFASLFFSLVIYIVLFAIAPFVSRIYHQDLLAPMIRIMGLTLPIVAVKSVWCAYISSHLLFRKFFFATLGGTIVSGIVGIYMALSGYGGWALVAQQMINSFIDTVILVATTRLHIKAKFSFDRLASLFRYAWKLFVSSLIGTIYTEISPLVIGIKFQATDLSFYTKGKSFPSMLSTTTTSTLSAVLFPVMAKYQDDKDRILYYTRSFIKVSSFVCFPIMLGFFAVSENFVRVVLTEQWLPSVYYIRVFCICNMFDVIAIGNCETIKAIGRSDVYLIIEIIKKVGYFITLLCFIFFSKSAHMLALAYVICTVIQIVVNSIPNAKLIQYRYKMQIEDLLPNLMLSLTMFIITYCVGEILPKGIMALLIQMLIGVLVFLGLCIATKNYSYRYLLNLLNNLKNRGESIE